jgi:hypothetical protein
MGMGMGVGSGCFMFRLKGPKFTCKQETMRTKPIIFRRLGRAAFTQKEVQRSPKIPPNGIVSDCSPGPVKKVHQNC